VVSIDMNPGKVVLFGLRPQHRAQTTRRSAAVQRALPLGLGEQGTKTSN